MENNTYETNNIALAAYLALYGLKYKDVRVGMGRNNTQRVFFVFENEAGVGKELEKEFIQSKERKYRDFLLFFRNVVSESIGK